MHLCPVCQKPLVSIEYSQIEIDYCPECRGCWLDRGELGLLLRGDPAADPALALEPGDRGQRRCPRCGDRMREAVMAQAGVQVDCCPHGHGLWLDRPELKAIVDAMADSGSLGRLSTFCESVFGAAST